VHELVDKAILFSPQCWSVIVLYMRLSVFHLSLDKEHFCENLMNYLFAVTLGQLMP